LFDIIFGQTVASAVTHMFRYDFRDDLPNFATSIAYFLPPAAAMLWAAAFCYGRRWTAPLKTGFVAVAATLSPLAILVMAWDLSRFLAWSTVAAGLVLVGTGSPRLVGLKDAA
jgi:hypothetical protein